MTETPLPGFPRAQTAKITITVTIACSPETMQIHKDSLKRFIWKETMNRLTSEAYEPFEFKVEVE